MRTLERVRKPLHVAIAVGCAAVLFGVAAPAHAVPEPELAIAVGHSFAVGSATKGAYDQGGFTAAVSALWPWENRFRFGVSLYAADFGGRTNRVVLPDASGGPSLDYGPIEQGHRDAWGAAWRIDALGPALFLGRSFATVDYGYFRLQNNRVGQTLGRTSAVGGTLGLGLEHTLTPHQTIRITVGATMMSDTFTKHYGSAGLEWGWRR